MRTLESFRIQGFKSIRDQELRLDRLNVFIGANGAGKSNLIGAFRFLREIVNRNLGNYTRSRGGADTLLHFGRKHSPSMAFHLEFGEGNRSNAYRLQLKGTDDDTLFVEWEQAFYHERAHYKKPYDRTIAFNEKESGLREHNHISARQVLRDLESYRLYHFHDTSDTAPVKGTVDLEDNKALRSHAENLAAFLYWMQEAHPGHFFVIQDTIRQIAPFFGSFQLAPSRLNKDKIRLEWNQAGIEGYFNASALSDGTLRFICLATLLLQPELPRVVLLDEPELGLHPAAITLLASLLSAAAGRTQVIVATQSVTLVNQFEPQDIWVAERKDQESTFRRLEESTAGPWLKDYSVGELWEKNLLGGRP